jgi:hypothetical protein
LFDKTLPTSRLFAIITPSNNLFVYLALFTSSSYQNMPRAKKTLKLTVVWVKKHIIAPLRNPAVDVNERLDQVEKLLGQLTEKYETVSLLKHTLIHLLY